ncbi:MAG: Transcriptional regulatory protein DegU [Pseudomonadota bacterium]|jgi:DNA-binding NarL/FixJ family response regulator
MNLRLTNDATDLSASDDTRIYLVEDDPTVLHFVQQALRLRPQWQLLGHSANLAHACQHAPTVDANVFLIDLGLPDGRGEQIMRLLARQKPNAELLVFTVFGEESRLIGALEAGATGYVLKGCSTDELLHAIEHIREGGAPISPLLARLLLKRFHAVPASSPTTPSDDTGRSEPEPLSERETDVLKLLAQGYLNKEIAYKLSIATTTVGSHVKNLYRKLAAHSRVQAVRIAQKRGLL